MEHASFAFHNCPPGEPVKGKTYRADGWAYVDPPSEFSPDMWELFLEVIGEGHYVVLAESQGVFKGGEPWRRGQLLVSPEGMGRLFEQLEMQP